MYVHIDRKRHYESSDQHIWNKLVTISSNIGYKV